MKTPRPQALKDIEGLLKTMEDYRARAIRENNSLEAHRLHQMQIRALHDYYLCAEFFEECQP